MPTISHNQQIDQSRGTVYLYKYLLSLFDEIAHRLPK